MSIGKFYIVSTPIGNMEDITIRALRTLKEVDMVLCEDTRVTHKLLSKYEIQTKTSSYHANSKLKKIDYIIDGLSEGKNFALVSDAGTPILSDPGILLVQEIYKKIPSVDVIAIPGASALLAAVVISGINTHKFSFLGFLPHKKGRETLFKRIRDSEETVVFYESVHRIEKCIDSLTEVLDESRRICLLKELTKMHEERIYGTAKYVKEYLSKNKDKIRGEFVVVVEGM